MSSLSLVSRSLVLGLATLLRSMIKAKEFTMSHLDRFNKIDVLCQGFGHTLLHNARVRQEL